LDRLENEEIDEKLKSEYDPLKGDLLKPFSMVETYKTLSIKSRR